MTVFDTVDQLESYLSAFPYLQHVIDILDRSLPWEKGNGFYSCEENSEVTYTVSSAVSSAHGYAFEVAEDSMAVIVTLEGEQLVSSPDSSSVFVLSPGRFVILDQGTWKRGVSPNLPSAFSDVVFHLPSRQKPG